MDSVYEKATARYTARLVDADGNAIPAASLSTLTLTLYNKLTGSVINSRSDQSVLNANGVTVDAQGNLTWLLSTGDTAIDDPTVNREIRRALFKWTWVYNAVVQTGRHAYDFEVRNESKVS